MTQRVTSRTQPGSIMLFHSGKENTPLALPLIIEKLQGEGYAFCKVGELIYYDNYTINEQGRQRSTLDNGE